MPEFSLSGTATVSIYTRVVADTLEEAIELSKTRLVEISGRGSDDNECWIIEEADGGPDDICSSSA